MNERHTYTPPLGWVIVGYRAYPLKSSKRLPSFKNYTDDPIHHFTDLRDEGRGLTAVVKGKPTQGQQHEWLLFSYMPVLEEFQVAV